MKMENLLSMVRMLPRQAMLSTLHRGERESGDFFVLITIFSGSALPLSFADDSLTFAF